jgi:hypothetical protein
MRGNLRGHFIKEGYWGMDEVKKKLKNEIKGQCVSDL